MNEKMFYVIVNHVLIFGCDEKVFKCFELFQSKLKKINNYSNPMTLWKINVALYVYLVIQFCLYRDMWFDI